MLVLAAWGAVCALGCAKIPPSALPEPPRLPSEADWDLVAHCGPDLAACEALERWLGDVAAYFDAVDALSGREIRQ